ncbi:helix-turn-helix domain-containing protein [Glutamicibacter protophormiae]|uniref:winged helix-turn-helix domain-containing protein n=1 Tax=Glutamicibacter protophormiae TaxID=37930 RepID=UPI002A806B04|nr:helix-turn-helix domain-containing protein [Glutamicibacter protophormiae]WPR64580.1 helix-turn-helix domain-containing protein [Glutamicibacter protophormiae]WPR68074.1 helix-turn-helix domain-containing protein [Glutamicibacter protophormiae]
MDRFLSIEKKLDEVLSKLEERAPGHARKADDKFWALQELRERVTDVSGQIMLLGSVVTPDGTPYEWQEGRTTQSLLERDWSEGSDVLAALAHPVRLSIMQKVVTGTGQTSAFSELDSVATTGQLHHHIRLLTAAGWLRHTARGQYSVPPSRVIPLLTLLSIALP